MMTLQLRSCIPNGKKFLILESIFSKGGIPQVANTVGPALTQVVRMVWGSCDVKDNYYKGKKIDESWSPWQGVKVLLNQDKIERKATGATDFNHEYVGFRNVVVPVQQIFNIVPQALTEPRTLSKAFSHEPYGVDPIPAIQLYGNKSVAFVSSGGDSPPTAMAFYYTETHKLELCSEKEMVEILAKLLGRHL